MTACLCGETEWERERELGRLLEGVGEFECVRDEVEGEGACDTKRWSGSSDKGCRCRCGCVAAAAGESDIVGTSVVVKFGLLKD